VDTSNAYKLSLGGTAMAFLGTVLSWFLLTYVGRRTIYIVGEMTCCVVLLIVGIISVSADNASGLWAQAAFTMLWLFVYSLTVGPIAYAIISETSSVRLRPQTVVLARNTYQLINIISGVLVPYMLNPLEWNWKGKSGFFWAGTAALMTIWAFFRLPEAKVSGRNLRFITNVKVVRD
jgi:MFS transporter, SP family, general alpha glucoside:H+ symporter